MPEAHAARFKLVVIGGLAAAAAVGVALAAPGGGTAPHDGEGGWHHHGHDCADLYAHDSAMLEFARVKLGITEAENGAWAKLASALQSADQPLMQLCQAHQAKLAERQGSDGKPGDHNPAPMALPEHLAMLDQMESAHLQRLHQLRPAIEAVYQQLTPEQKAEADRMIGRLAGGHHPHPGGWGMMEHHPGPAGEHP